MRDNSETVAAFSASGSNDGEIDNVWDFCGGDATKLSVNLHKTHPEIPDGLFSRCLPEGAGRENGKVVGLSHAGDKRRRKRKNSMSDEEDSVRSVSRALSVGLTSLANALSATPPSRPSSVDSTPAQVEDKTKARRQALEDYMRFAASMTDVDPDGAKKARLRAFEEYTKLMRLV